MTGAELIVTLLVLLFLVFCLTAIAVIAMSKDKDELAEKSITALRELSVKQKSDEEDPRDETTE